MSLCLCWCMKVVQFHSCASSCPVFSTPFIEETVFFPLHILASFVKINWSYHCGFISGISILFHWSMCLFLCQYHTVLITAALWRILKSGIVIPLVLFFFFKIALALQSLLWFHMNFRIICVSSVKNAISILIGIALNLLWIVWTF